MSAYLIAGIGLVAAFVTQVLKDAVDERFHRYIPVVLGILMALVGGGVAWYSGEPPDGARGQAIVVGVFEGIFAAAVAVYGYEFVKNLGVGQS